MPTGTFAGLTPDNRAGGSITGTGSPSQPKSLGNSVMTGRQDQYGGGYGDGSSSSYVQARQGQYGNGGGGGSYKDNPNFVIQNTTVDPATATGLYGLPGQSAGPPNTLAGAQSLVDSIYGPQQQILADQLARQQSQLGMVATDAQYQTDAQNRDYQLALKGLGLDKQALGLDSGLTKTQLTNLDKLRGILKQQYGLQGEVLANQMAGFAINEGDVKDQAGRKQWDLRSDLTQRGAFNTIANERGTGRINRDRDTALAGIDNQRGMANLSYRGNILGLDEKGIGYDNQQASLQARLSGIGIDMSRLGLSEEALSNKLSDGLHQIGLGSYTSINNLLDAIGGTNAQQSQLAGTILQQVLSYSNLPPAVLQQLTAALGGSSGGGYSGGNPAGGGGANGPPI